MSAESHGRPHAVREASAPGALVLDEGLDGEDKGRSSDFVQSLERGLAVIRAFDRDHPSLSVSEVAEISHLTRAAARRFLLTLTHLGYVTERKGRYQLAPRVLTLGYAYLSSLSFPEVALPFLERLVTQTREASEGAILDQNDIVYVVRVPGPALMTISVNIGERRPAHLTAMGRVLLADLPSEQLEKYLAHVELHKVLKRTITDRRKLRAELERVHRNGYALVNQELEEGLVAVAVPVHDRDGQTRAAINLSTHVGRKTVETMLSLVPLLKETAAGIEHTLAHLVSWPD
jgi:IclR family pca regulon transcriptional regulator